MHWIHMYFRLLLHVSLRWYTFGHDRLRESEKMSTNYLEHGSYIYSVAPAWKWFLCRMPIRITICARSRSSHNIVFPTVLLFSLPLIWWSRVSPCAPVGSGFPLFGCGYFTVCAFDHDRILGFSNKACDKWDHQFLNPNVHTTYLIISYYHAALYL